MARAHTLPNKFVATADQRMRVSIMAACGMRQELICEQIKHQGKPIDTKTLRAHFRAELDQGKADANALVANSLFKKAIGTGPSSVTAAIFWLKTQAGWKETSALEHTGAGGGPVVVERIERTIVDPK